MGTIVLGGLPVHDPITPLTSTSTTPENPQVLLLWAVRVRESGERAMAEAAALTRALEHRALHGLAGDALAELGAAVARGVRDTGLTALEAADQLTRAAHRAQLALDAAVTDGAVIDGVVIDGAVADGPARR